MLQTSGRLIAATLFFPFYASISSVFVYISSDLPIVVGCQCDFMNQSEYFNLDLEFH